MVNFMDFYYTGPGTLAGQYMRKFWHPVLRAEDLKPGWAKPIKILGEELRPAVQLRQQSGKRSDSYSVYAPRVGVLYESPAGDSRHHGRGKRLGRAVNFALSQRAALYHATRAA